MASGHANRANTEHMAAPTTAARVKKALANPEPSTHGPMPSEFLMAAALVARSAVPRMR